MQINFTATKTHKKTIMPENDVNALADMLEGKTPQQAQAPTEQPPAAPVTPPPAAPPANEPVVPPAPPETDTTPPNTPNPAQPPLDINAELVRITGGAAKTPEEIATFIERAN